MSKDSNLVVKFRKIPSLKFLYEVSEDGRIVRNVKSKHHLRQEQERGGYYRVHPVLNGKQVHRLVHLLVAECWLGAKPEGLECDHIDRDRHNNHYTNLRYVTRKENHKNRVFSEEGKRRNSEITKARYYSATPERQKEMVAPMIEAALRPEVQAKRLKACIETNGFPVTISKNGEDIHFESHAKCCHYIAQQVGCSVGAIEYYLHHRRKYVHGYHITYERT